MVIYGITVKAENIINAENKKAVKWFLFDNTIIILFNDELNEFLNLLSGFYSIEFLSKLEVN